MRYFNIILIIILSSTLTFAQYSEGFIQENEYDAPNTITKKDTTQRKIFTNIAIGSTVMSSGNNNYSFNTYVNPTVSYQLNPRFSISMGLMAVQSNFNNFTFYNYEGQVHNINYSGTSAYFTLQGAFVLIKNNEAFLINSKIPQYKFAHTVSQRNYDIKRTRKLLLTKKQIMKLQLEN